MFKIGEFSRLGRCAKCIYRAACILRQARSLSGRWWSFRCRL